MRRFGCKFAMLVVFNSFNRQQIGPFELRVRPDEGDTDCDGQRDKGRGDVSIETG
jgi:hypothetical protein